jgi:HlyD family secretion protein
MSQAVILAPPADLTEIGDPKNEIRAGIAVAAGFFLLFLGWSAFLPLDAGVTAPISPSCVS